ncbi:thioredoxin domain-containing protein [Ornithinimicrobium sp. Arc0846-15]|nr:thioredoxin domain-containing protein [Ornithinimicrobium laminariae]
MAQRLSSATSPYLVQHAGNPVDWWEWTDEAFSQAKESNRPILLSIGYAACHWCHVMAHESFEDDEVATLLNEHFVSIKVDREERPDVDSVYMSATTAMTGHGGWPMTCLLTPDGKPFWCGTYLPKSDFIQLLTAANEAWRDREAEVRAGGDHVVSALAKAAEDSRSARPVSEATLDTAVQTLSREYDHAHGGFGRAPKFPPSMVLAFLLRYAVRTDHETAWDMLLGTTEAMARSGTYDQVGGGFARYAVDSAWVVPHFEKMLYDNALLLAVYADLLHVQRSNVSDWARPAVDDTVAWLLREMRTEQGGFASSLDADTEGVEGSTYVWSPAQLREVLSEDDAERATELLLVTPDGTFEDGLSTLQFAADATSEDRLWWASVKPTLLRHRNQRPQPGRDDKVVTAWNGLMIDALVRASMAAHEPAWLDGAADCARFLLDVHVYDGRVIRSSRDGAPGKAAGVAEDYGNLLVGLISLHAATGEASWLESAEPIATRAIELFSDGRGGFNDTASDSEPLVLRPQSSGDNAEPSGHSALTLGLMRYATFAGSAEILALAEGAIAEIGELAHSAPRFAGWILTAAEESLAGPLQVAIARGDDEAGALALIEAVLDTQPALAVLAGRGDDQGVPLLRGREAINGAAAAYVCRGTVCDLPITDPDELRTALKAKG